MSAKNLSINQSFLLNLFDRSVSESTLLNNSQSDTITGKDTNYDGDFTNSFDQLSNATKLSTFTTESYFQKNDSIIDDEPFKKDFVFDRTDVRVIFITMYTLVFCCCFFGKYFLYVSFFFVLFCFFFHVTLLYQ